MKQTIKNLSLRKKAEFYLATSLGWVAILLLGHSLRLKCQGLETIRRFREQGQPFLIALWHGRFLIPLYHFRRYGFVVLVSQHLDGEMITRNLHRLGYGTVRGSSTRGGQESFYEMVRIMRRGRTGVILPDGPTGPRHKLKAGVTFMAMKAGVPIVPMTFSSRPAITLKSWDRFLIPRPRARTVLKIGAPIWIPADCGPRELVRWSRRIEQQMIAQEQAADAAVTAR